MTSFKQVSRKRMPGPLACSISIWSSLIVLCALAACKPVSPTTPLTPSLTSPVSTILSQSPSPVPTSNPAPTQTSLPVPAPLDEPMLLPSPDGKWKAILNSGTGSLVLEDLQGAKHTVFPAGSIASDARWSPESLRLAVVVRNKPQPPNSPDQTGIAEIWLVTVADHQVSKPRLVFQPGSSDKYAGEGITLGIWSPEGTRLLFWGGHAGASIQADGLPLWSLEIATGQATRLAETALVNPTYQSWAPNGHALAFTNGGYRSAQVGKWLSLYEVELGQIRSLIARSELIPGALAWSPKVNTIAFAAVRESQTGTEWADWMSWDNPAIQARRIYLLDPQNGDWQRLNTTEAYQDTPRWSADGSKLYYVQIDGDQVVLMAADPLSGEVQPLPGCQAPLPSRAGYYGQADWTALYENCPEAAQISAPSLSNLSSPEQDAQATQIEAINAIRTLFELPDLSLEFVEMATMINSPNGDLAVALYEDTEGRKYYVEPERDQVVEIDARAALSTISPDAVPLPQNELSAKAMGLIQGAIPNFDLLQAGLTYEESVKGDHFFFDWRAIHSSGSMNRPFVQIGLHKSGELFAYYKTLTLIEKAGATITGQVIAGYGDHQPLSGLPLRIRQKDNENWDTYTDENGYFTLAGLPVGRVDIDDSHLSFWVTIDLPSQAVDLGKLKYPLFHPPNYYWWQAAPLADLDQLLRNGKPVAYEVCAADLSWVRPGPDMQREQVYMQPPFDQFDEKGFGKYEHMAVLYDTIDVTQQSFPGGLNLDELGADWLYLTGLWTVANNPISNSNCSYASQDLQSLLNRSYLEVWLFGYQAIGVQKLDKESAEVAEGVLCDPNERSCTVRPGHHYAVQVVPSAGFQIIRFAGEQDVLAVHIVEAGIEIFALP